jgi:hypothetical protein
MVRMLSAAKSAVSSGLAKIAHGARWASAVIGRLWAGARVAIVRTRGLFKRDRVRSGISYLVGASTLFVALYVEEIRQLHISLQVLLILVLSALQPIAGSTIDYFRERRARASFLRDKRLLVLEKERTQAELDEFRQVVASFLEHAEVYRDRVKDYLKLGEDYLCVIKSSEGLSKVWTQLENRVMLPFGSVLLRIPGCVKPFERIGMFLIPLGSLPGLNEWNVRAYFAKHIIPEVEKERERFLRTSGIRASRDAEPFSYKYMAFPVRKGAISFDTHNRKFNREFNVFIVAHQVGASYARMRQTLAEVVKAKDILARVNWSSFAGFNSEQRRIVEEKRRRMSDVLAAAGIDTLAKVADAAPERLCELVWPVLRRQTTRVKALNICKRLADGAGRTVGVLRKHGVEI